MNLKNLVSREMEVLENKLNQKNEEKYNEASNS